MFTGIIETTGIVIEKKADGSNIHFSIEADFCSELKVDQSIAHNGVCLTVTSVKVKHYTVTAIDETLQKSNLGKVKIGDKVNLERAMLLSQRLDGHFVQGHVDTVGKCTAIKDEDGSWGFEFEYNPENESFLTVSKGSITINGVSLTVVVSETGKFSVAIIPYTYAHTNFKDLKVGDEVNLEFDILGKYIVQLFNRTKLKE
jgi:riboflavin synthase